MSQYAWLPLQSKILLALLENQQAGSSCFIGGVARILDQNPGSVHREITKLASRGLIDRSNEVRGLPVFLTLTPAGKDSAQDLLANFPDASFGLCPSAQSRQSSRPRTRPPVVERSATLEILQYIHNCSGDEPVDAASVVANTSWSRPVVQRAVEWLYLFDLLSRTGQGKPGNPWRYSISPAGCVLVVHLKPGELKEHLGSLAENLLSSSAQR